MVGRELEVYIDYIVIMAQSEEQHLLHLRKAFASKNPALLKNMTLPYFKYVYLHFEVYKHACLNTFRVTFQLLAQ